MFVTLSLSSPVYWCSICWMLMSWETGIYFPIHSAILFPCSVLVNNLFHIYFTYIPGWLVTIGRQNRVVTVQNWELSLLFLGISLPFFIFYFIFCWNSIQNTPKMNLLVCTEIKRLVFSHISFGNIVVLWVCIFSLEIFLTGIFEHFKEIRI